MGALFPSLLFSGFGFYPRSAWFLRPRLARSGVGRLRLVDFDNVSLSSLNRHAVATRDDVGRPKVTVCAERFRDFVHVAATSTLICAIFRTVRYYPHTCGVS